MGNPLVANAMTRPDIEHVERETESLNVMEVCRYALMLERKLRIAKEALRDNPLALSEMEKA